MNNIEQIRESISDASYALTQVGEDVDYVALLTMRARLNRLVDLEYSMLSQGQMVSGSVPDEGGWVENTGSMPCSGPAVIEVRLASGVEGVVRADLVLWDFDIGFGTITHWRFPATA